MKYLSLLKDITGDNKIYIVGGAVRDYLLNKEIKDIDLIVMSDFENIIDRFTNETDRKLIVLDKKRSIYRIVTDDNKFIDFTTPVGQDLYQDLGCRDFTINSMALDLRDVSYKNEKIFMDSKDIIDPFEGRSDLENKIIRLVSEDSIKEDPLRILRAFRFSNNLDFLIEEKTYEIIKENINITLKPANERIKEELYQLYSNYLKPARIKLLLESNILKVLFGVDLKKDRKIRKKLLKQLHFVKKNRYLENIKIESYLFNLILFFMFLILKNKVTLKQLEDRLINYTFNKQGIDLVIDHLHFIKNLLRDYKSYLNNDILLYEELFSKSIDIKVSKYLLLSFFHVKKDNKEKELVFKVLNKVAEMQKRTAEKLISGNDIKKVLNIEEGKLVGEILEDIKEKQALGVFNKREEILNYIKDNY